MKIIIATGGSGGHIFPAALVAGELKRDSHEVLMMGVFKQYTRYLESRQLVYEEHNATGVFGPGKNDYFSSIVNMFKAIKACHGRLKDLKPDVVAGFGGYGAFPVVAAALLLKIPTIIHEQNVVPGRANRLLGFFVRDIAISFAQTKHYWKNMKQVLTGCPGHVKIIQNGKEKIYADFGLSPGKKTLLVLGGSQGSRKLNEVCSQAVRVMPYADQLQVIHVAGYGQSEATRQAYGAGPVAVKVFDFLDNIAEAMHVADVVIARAGALTVMEIAGYNKSAVLVPYPFAGGHQMHNARVLQESGHARIIEEAHFTPLSLAQTVKDLLESGTEHAMVDGPEHKVYIEDAVTRIKKLILGA